MQFFDTHFSILQFYGLVCGLLFGVCGIIYFLQNKMRASLAFVFLAGLVFRLIMAEIDPYLNLWDEQYHALVAKHMMDHPFTPMLYTHPALYYNPENWSANHIWLHKQPLFLWQIALSFKLFGVNEFALRLPSAIMSAFTVLLIFRIGKLLVNERVGWCAALLFAFSSFNLEVAGGNVNTDHNDLSFMFYVTASIWAWMEYVQSRKIKWVILIGVLSGMAILVKWLTGLLVFSGWFMIIVFDKTKRGQFTYYKDMLIAFLITCVVVLPWQIYKSIRFPIESALEYKQYGLHITLPLDGHNGTWFYHFDQLSNQLGPIIPFIIIPGLLILLNGIKERPMKIAFLTFLIIVHLFFMYVATKMPLLCYFIMPLLFLCLGALLEKVLSSKISIKKLQFLIPFLVTLIIAFVSLDIASIEGKHTNRDPQMTYRKMRIRNTEYA